MFAKLIPAVTVLAALVGGTSAWTPKAPTADECCAARPSGELCFPGSPVCCDNCGTTDCECCYDGSPCCGDNCCPDGAVCCSSGESCCTAMKAWAKTFDCCAGGECCDPPGDCCAAHAK
jgi:hypothetical protein